MSSDRFFQNKYKTGGILISIKFAIMLCFFNPTGWFAVMQLIILLPAVGKLMQF